MCFSDCVRLKAADIQPDIFSYLLNLMYTGKLAPQLIDPARLEQGVRFLHAYPLLQEASQSVYSHPEHSINLSTSLYGIQISDQQVALSARLPTRRQLSSPFDMEQHSSEGKFPSTTSAAVSYADCLPSKLASSPLDGEASTSGTKPSAEEGGMDLINADGSSVNAILHVKPSIMKRSASFRKHYSCHLCSSRFTQRSLLREHLLQHTHALQQVSAEPSNALSPVMTAEQRMLEVEGFLKGSKAGSSA